MFYRLRIGILTCIFFNLLQILCRFQIFSQITHIYDRKGVIKEKRHDKNSTEGVKIHQKETLV